MAIKRLEESPKVTSNERTTRRKNTKEVKANTTTTVKDDHSSSRKRKSDKESEKRVDTKIIKQEPVTPRNERTRQRSRVVSIFLFYLLYSLLFIIIANCYYYYTFSQIFLHQNLLQLDVHQK